MLFLFLLLPAQGSAGLPDTVARVKQSVVAIGTYQATRRPPAVFRGTGFAVLDGRHIVTNAHVLPTETDSQRKEQLAVFLRRGKRQERRVARVVARDTTHDLALLAIGGTALPTLKLGDDAQVREGEPYAFTGFPIGMVLGLTPVTHRGIVSAITPVAIPAISSRQLDTRYLRRLRKPFDVFQLDAIAYPGNSGSPLYAIDTGRVVGVVNSVFVKETKESILSSPSGIAYAIPAKYIKKLFKYSK